MGERPALRVTITRGRARVTVPERARSPLRLGRATLGMILYGGVSSREAASLGQAQADPSTLARAYALFATPPFFALDTY